MSGRRLDAKVLDCISMSIATDWKRLCRFLDVSDDTIDNIEADHMTTAERAYEGLRCFTKHCDDQYADLWGRVRNALLDIKRQDVVKKAEEIMTKGIYIFLTNRYIYKLEYRITSNLARL